MLKTEASVKHMGYIGKIPGQTRDSDSWYTPPTYIEAARTVLGSIELDPYSSEYANGYIKAKVYYTADNPAEPKEWDFKTVWMNPPYSAKGIKSAVDKFVEEYKKYKFSAIVLTNNSTDTKWFQTLASLATSMCFTNHRISFNNIDGKNISNNTRGQTFFYFGRRPTKFKQTFSKFGLVVRA